MPETLEEVPTTVNIERGTEHASLIADQIERLASAGEDLLATGLTDRAIVVLLQDHIGPTHIGRREIQLVLDALPELRRYAGDA